MICEVQDSLQKWEEDKEEEELDEDGKGGKEGKRVLYTCSYLWENKGD